jgi:hypothetical protein
VPELHEGQRVIVAGLSILGRGGLTATNVQVTGTVRAVDRRTGMVTVTLDPEFSGQTIVVAYSRVSPQEPAPASEQPAQANNVFTARELAHLEFVRWLVATKSMD